MQIVTSHVIGMERERDEDYLTFSLNGRRVNAVMIRVPESIRICVWIILQAYLNLSCSLSNRFRKQTISLNRVIS